MMKIFNPKGGAMNVTGSGNIITSGQTGGNNTIINAVPKAEVKILETKITDNKDGTFSFEETTEIKNCSSLRTEASAQEIISSSMNPADASATSVPVFYNHIEGPQIFGATIQNPYGKYVLKITYKGSERPRVQYTPM